MSTLNWVVGASGLLGSAVVRQLHKAGDQVFDGPRISWGTPAAGIHLTAGLAALIRKAAGQRWHVYWCAGVGVTGSAPEEFELEAATFKSFLDSAKMLPSEVLDRGSLFVTSSAGAVYGGSQGAPFHEYSEVVPLGGYGHGKLVIEEVTRSFSDGTGVRCLVGRISNLYGPGQSLSKPQGLISHLCLSTLTRKPLSVFVSLDTLRDYLFVDDCAELIIAASRRLRIGVAPTFNIKIFASGRSVSIGALLSEFKQIVGRRPAIIMGLSPQSAFQSTDLRLRSRYWTELDERSSTNLADGIARTLQDLRNSFLRPTL